MSNYDNNNRGAIWGNDKKVKDTQPDFTGSILVDGKDYFVSGWKRKADASPVTAGAFQNNITHIKGKKI